MRTNYDGKAVVDRLRPEELTPNPPDVAIALEGITNVRTRRDRCVWPSFFFYSAILAVLAIAFTTNEDLPKHGDWLHATMGIAMVAFGFLGVFHLIWGRRHWQIEVQRNSRWKKYKPHFTATRAQTITEEIRAAIYNGEAEYVIPQG